MYHTCKKKVKAQNKTSIRGGAAVIAVEGTERSLSNELLAGSSWLALARVSGLNLGLNSSLNLGLNPG